MKVEKRWVRITHPGNIPPREGREVNAGGREIALFNLGDRFLAIGNRCPHRSGPLADGIVSGDTVVCPLHAWKFSLDTGKGIGNASASSCVETFRTRVENGVVLLELPVKSSVNDGLPPACFEQGETVNWSESSSAAGD